MEADIDFPSYHPHTLWWLAYISEILKGKTIENLLKNPPWPVPNKPLITKQIIKELMDARWILPDWEKDFFTISPKILEIYKKGGENALAQELLKFKTVKGEWWIDSISGSILSRLTALRYDVDFSRKEPRNLHRIRAKIKQEDLLGNIDLNITDLLNNYENKSHFRGAQLSMAYLSSTIKITGQKDIRFPMYGASNVGERILPNDLEALESMLLEISPNVFGNIVFRKKKIFSWRSSPIEKFALILESFPNHVSLLTSNKYFIYRINQLKELVNKQEEWINWFIDGIELQPIAGETNLLFDSLYETCNEVNIENNKQNKLEGSKSPSHVILTTSFLNKKNLEKDIGLHDIIKNSNSEILIIYGHANDETPEQQEKTMIDYLSELAKIDQSTAKRVQIISAKKRSHEKIIVSSKGDWMIGSWNPGSSRPNSKQFEVCIKGRSKLQSLKLLEILEEIIEDTNGLNFLSILRKKISNIIEDMHRKKKEAEKYIQLLEKVTDYFSLILGDSDSINLANSYEDALNAIRLALVPFLKKCKVKFVNEHQSRDIFITQINNSKQDIFIASDRVNRSALDSTLINDLYKSSSSGKKYLRILWGREWENEKHLSKESKQQIKDARNAIRSAKKVLGRQLITELVPMENHSKFVLVDGARGLITSENILSYGGEKTKYESRELGAFVEGLPVIRYIQGKAIQHRMKYFHPDRDNPEMTYRPYEWIIEGIDQYFAFDLIKNELDIEWDTYEIINSAIVNDLSDSNNSHDEFDKLLHKDKLKCFEERQTFIKEDFGEYLWKEGIRCYLLIPDKDSKWIPFIKNLTFKECGKNIHSLLSNIDKKIRDIKESDIKITIESKIKKVDNEVLQEIMDNIVHIKKGSFLMGNEMVPNERPVHTVIISKDFYISKFVVTQNIWKKVMGDLPQIHPKNLGGNNPIINVSYKDTQDFLEKLNSLQDSGGFDLPTEAQWEYTCRAGTNSEYYFGNDIEKLEEYAWTKRNSKGKLHRVGLKKPNNWGLFDMHGLVYEHIKDDLRKFSEKTITDPVGPLNTEYICYKSGAWTRYPKSHNNNKKQEHFRCSFRDHHLKTEKSYRTSFRLVRNIISD